MQWSDEIERREKNLLTWTVEKKSSIFQQLYYEWIEEMGVFLGRKKSYVINSHELIQFNGDFIDKNGWISLWSQWNDNN